MKQMVIFSLLCLLNMTSLHAKSESALWYTHDAKNQVVIHVDLFVSSTCPYCHKADAYFSGLEQTIPWLVVHRYVINLDKAALQTFADRLEQPKPSGFSVPAIFFCGSRWAGFNDVNMSGKALLHGLNYCRQKITQQGKLTPSTMAVLQQWGTASQFQISPAIARSVLPVVMLTALMDAFSPCSLFCFAAFLAFLWLYPTQKWLQFSLGMVFLLSLGVVHYTQQVFAAFYYQLIPKLTLFEMLVGLLLLLHVLNSYRYMRSQRTLKVSPLVVALVFFTAFTVQIYQQTCVFNMSLILEQWLAERAFSPTMQVYYQFLYQIFYLLPLTVVLLLYLLFGCHQRMVIYQRRLEMAAYLILLSIGAILVAYPPLLASVLASLAVLAASILVGWRIAKGFSPL